MSHQDLSNLSLVSIDGHCWSGSARIRRSDLPDSVVAQLPSKKVATDGEWRLVPREPIQCIIRCRDKARGVLMTGGFRFLGGFAVPTTEIERIQRELDAVVDESEKAVNALVDGLDGWYVIQEAESAAFAPALRANRLTAAEVRSRCSLSYDIVNVTAAPGAEDVFQRTADKAVPAFLSDLGLEAEKSWRESFAGKSEVGQRALRPLRRLVEKLIHFGFLDPKVEAAGNALASALSDFPTTGNLDATETAMAAAMLMGMTRPDLLLESGDRAIAAFQQPVAADTDEPEEEASAEAEVPVRFAANF